MNKFLKPVFVTAIAGSSYIAQAVEYQQVVADKSEIQFIYQQMGVAMEGRFRKFASQLKFDPAKLATANALIEVDLASIDTGAPEGDQEVAGKTWFNTKIFPTAQFVSSGIKPLGNNRYEVLGKLTIKGKTQDVVAPAVFALQGNVAVFEGSFMLRRGDFAIGEGAWSSFDIVANNVTVKFRITATGK